jgi:hypothetical protein
MDFTLTADQTALATAVERLAARFQQAPHDFRGLTLVSAELEQELAAAEFFDIANVDELGPVAAALTVERLARLPYAAEIALSMLVRPHLPESRWPRPLAFIEDGRPGRFVANAKTVIVKKRDELGIGLVPPGGCQEVASICAYPMGRLTEAIALTPLTPSEASAVQKWLRVALAAETAGLLQAGIDRTVEHLIVRKQFGRPLGSFQALRHRLAECAVLTGGVKWLALKAASTQDDGDAALAALHAQETATRVTFELHQMLGAMGMTLEHPLHLWTYRLKALLPELGGRDAQAQAVVRHCFA